MGLFNNLSSDSSTDYTKAYDQYLAALNAQNNATNQYAGNAGYQNTINQGLFRYRQNYLSIYVRILVMRIEEMDQYY